MSALATAGVGFLLAELWMDLMFDVQVLRHRSGAPELPEPVLASIAGCYRHVTTDGSPMGRAIGAVMLATFGALHGELFRGGRPAGVSVARARGGAGRARRPARVPECGAPRSAT